MAASSPQKIKVAIIGGGIAGLSLLFGLLKHPDLEPKLYEAGPEIAGDAGAGVGLAINALKALELIDPELVRAVERSDSVALSMPIAKMMMGDENHPHYDKEILGVSARDEKNGGYLFQRSRFISELFKLMPASSCVTNKKLARVSENETGVTLYFEDGTNEEVHALIGGDGIHSNVRKHVLRNVPGNWDSFFCKQYSYISLVPMKKALEVLGDKYLKVACQYCWLGKGNFLIHDPCNNGETLQLIAVTSCPDETWDPAVWIKEKSLDDLKHDLSGLGDTGKGFYELLSSQPQPLNVLSTWEHPPTPSYSSGNSCILGDAAHSMQPWQAAGAGQAIEDAMILSTLFSHVKDPARIPSALKVYTEVRRDRTQYVQRMSAEMGTMLLGEGKKPLDVEMLRNTIPGRWDEMWYFDLESHQKEAEHLLQKV